MGERAPRTQADVAPVTRATPPSRFRNDEHDPVRADALLEIRLLGGFEARWFGVPWLALSASRRTRSLVQHLVVARGAPVARDELAFELWPDVPETKARANLRQALLRAARVWPRGHRFVTATLTTIAWDVDAPAEVDVLRFDECLRSAALARTAGDVDARVAALHEAVDLYRGDLSVEVAGGRMERARASLRAAVFRALDELVTVHVTRDRPAEAIACCERMLELDPLDEPTYVRLMRLHEARGAPRKGLHVYERLRGVLRDEVASTPGSDSERIAVQLEASVVGARHDDAAPFAALRERLVEAASRSRAEGAQVLVVRADQARARAERPWASFAADPIAAGVRLLRARAQPDDARLPLATVARLLGPTRLALAAERVGAPWSTELRRLGGAEALTLSPARTGVDASQRAALFDALCAALQLERGALVLLMIEDAEHIDAASTRWLRSLLERAGPGPLVVLMIGPGADGDDTALRRLVTHARSVGRAAEVDLGVVPRSADAGGPVAGTHGLTELARRVLEALAVLGSESAVETVRRVAARPRSEVGAALDELSRRGLVAVSQGGRTLALAAGALRDEVLAGLPPATRALLHGQAADALRGGPRGLARHDAVVAEHLQRAGRTAEAATAWAEAARRAASVAAFDVAISGYERAIALAREAVYGVANRTVATLWRELGEVHARRMDGGSARGAFLEAARHATDDPVTLALLVLRRAETHVAERAFDEALGELDIATAVLRSAPRRSRAWWRTAIDVDALRSRALYFLPDASGVGADDILSLLARLERAVARYGTLAQRVEADQAVLRFQMRDERYRLSAATCERLQQAARTAVATGDAVTIADTRFGAAFAALFSGSTEEAMALLEEARDLAERCGVRLLLVQSVAYLGVACRLARRLDRLEPVQGELDSLVDASTVLYTGLAQAQRAYLAYAAGEAPRAAEAIEAALATWGTRWYPFRWTALAVALALATSPATARAAAAMMLAPDQHRPPPAVERALRRLLRARASFPQRHEEALAALRAEAWL